MGRALGARPKSIALLGLLQYHRSALDFDLWAAQQLRVAPFLSAARWSELWSIVQQILRDPFCRLASEIRGDRFQPSPDLEAAYTLLDGIQAMLRGKNAVRPKPIKRPWEGRPPRYDDAPGATAGTLDPERAARRARLDELTAVTG